VSDLTAAQSTPVKSTSTPGPPCYAAEPGEIRNMDGEGMLDNESSRNTVFRRMCDPTNNIPSPHSPLNPLQCRRTVQKYAWHNRGTPRILESPFAMLLCNAMYCNAEIIPFLLYYRTTLDRASRFPEGLADSVATVPTPRLVQLGVVWMADPEVPSEGIVSAESLLFGTQVTANLLFACIVDSILMAC